MTVWTLKQILAGKIPQTNEEFIEYMKKKDRMLCVLPVAGILLLFLGFCSEWLELPINDYMYGFYAGAGTGLIVDAI